MSAYSKRMLNNTPTFVKTTGLDEQGPFEIVRLTSWLLSITPLLIKSYSYKTVYVCPYYSY